MMRQLAEDEARRREQQARQADQERVDDLLDQADRCQRAKRLRRFIEARRSTRADAAWLQWADGVAESIDPAADGEATGPPPSRVASSGSREAPRRQG